MFPAVRAQALRVFADMMIVVIMQEHREERKEVLLKGQALCLSWA